MKLSLKSLVTLFMVYAVLNGEDTLQKEKL